MCSPVLDRAFQVKRPWRSRAMSVTRGADFVLWIKKTMGQFCRSILSVSHVVQSVPQQFETEIIHEPISRSGTAWSKYNWAAIMDRILLC